MVNAQDMPDLDRQKLLTAELVKYKELQESISDSKRIKDKKAQKTVSIIQNQKQLNNNWNMNSVKDFDQKMVLISSKQLNDAIDEIKKFVGSEINSLKEMLVSNQKI